MRKRLPRLIMLSLLCISSHYAQATITQNTQGFYQISNAAELVEFSNLVNEYPIPSEKTIVDVYYSAVLTANIDMSGYNNFTPIGSNGRHYVGTFDGQGYVISHLTVDYSATTDPAGLFGTIYAATIKNLTLDETCSITGGGRCGLIGNSDGVKEIYLTGLGNMGSVHSTATGGVVGDTGGIIGGCTNGSILIAKRCWCTGNVTCDHTEGYAAALVGWTNSKSAQIEECWSTSKVTGNGGEANYFVRYGEEPPVITRCYCKNGNQVTSITDDQVHSGEFCYKLLNGESSVNPKWFQSLDGSGKTIPLPSITGKIVYYVKVQSLNCDGTDKSVASTETYTNMPYERDAHTISAGKCTVCEAKENEYQIPTANALRWLSCYVNDGKTLTKAYLTNDIDLKGPNFEPIGTSYHPYLADFDGQNHKISNLTVSKSAEDVSEGLSSNDIVSVAGLFGQVGKLPGQTYNIQNFWLYNSNVSGCVQHMGGICGRTQRSKVNFYNVGYDGSVQNTTENKSSSSAAGIVGNANNGSQANMDFCWVKGTIKGTKQVDMAALSAWEGGNQATISNCWAIATSESPNGFTSGHYLARCMDDKTTITNCYANQGSQADGSNEITTDMMTCGQLAYTMNQGTSGTSKWRQNLDGTQDIPTANPDNEKVLYVGQYGYTAYYDVDQNARKLQSVDKSVEACIGANGKRGGKNVVVLTPIQDIPANTAVVIKKTEGKGYYNNKIVDSTTSDVTGNIFLGSDGNVQGTVDAQGHLHNGATQAVYALSVKNEVVGFYPVKYTVKVPRGKAYFLVGGNNGNAIQSFYFADNEGEETSIESINTTNETTSIIYNLSGQRFSAPQKGINIINGKKVLY